MTYEDDEARTMWFANWHSDEMYQFVRSQPLHVERTDYQRLEVIDTELYGRLMLLNGEIQIASECDAVVHEAMCHPAMVLHDNPANVLIVGGGDGGSTREVLKHDPGRVDLVEIDERVVEVCREYFPEFTCRLDDDRVHVHNVDGRRFVREVDRTYDVVIMDISDPQGPAKTVFTREFYDEVTDVMADESVLVTHCESPDSSGDVFYRVLATLEDVFDTARPYRHWVPAYIDFWGRVIASDAYDPRDLTATEIANRLDERGVECRWLTPELCHAMFRSLNRRVIEGMNEDWEPITSSRPVHFERP